MASITEFKNKLENLLVAKKLEVQLWKGSARRSTNLLEINTTPKPTVIYVKISNSNPGFWGLTKNQVDRLNSSKSIWYAVLLARSPERGYCFSSHDVNSKIRNGTFELSVDGDYKVNEGTDCDSSHSFDGISKLIDKII